MSPPSDLSEEALARRLTTRRFGRAYTHLESCDSTNDRLAERAREGAAEGSVLTADTQSGGRGRLGRTWFSPPGANLYLSLLLRPERPAIDIPPITLMAGGALARTVRRFGIDAHVKWPNDLLVKLRAGGGAPDDADGHGDRDGRGGGDGGFRKAAGILTEAATDADRVVHVVVGIGVNVNGDGDGFPESLAGKAASLRQILGRPLARDEVLAQLLADFEDAYDDFLARGARAAIALWEAHAELGERCRARGIWGPVEGITVGVGSAGELLVRDDHGIVHAVVSGEVLPVTLASSAAVGGPTTSTSSMKKDGA